MTIRIVTLILLLTATVGCASLRLHNANVRAERDRLKANGCVTVVADGDVWHSYNFDKKTPYVLDDDVVMWKCNNGKGRANVAR